MSASLIVSIRFIPWTSESTVAILSSQWAVRLQFVLAAIYTLATVRSLRTPLRDWGWSSHGVRVLREISIGAAAALVMWPLLALRGTVLDSHNDLLSIRQSLILSFVAWTPMLEETLFRGMLYRHVRDHLRWLPTVMVTSVVFALMHSSSRMPSAYMAGLVYGCLREWRRSLLAPVVAHAASNLLSMAAAGLL